MSDEDRRPTTSRRLLTCPSKFRPPNVLGYLVGDLDHEEIQRKENHQSSTGGGRRHHGPGSLPKNQITEQSFYHWRNKFGSMTVLEVRCLKELDILPFVNSYCGSVNPRLKFLVNDFCV